MTYEQLAHPGRDALEAEARRLADEYRANPSGALEVQLRNVLARIRNHIY